MGNESSLEDTEKVSSRKERLIFFFYPFHIVNFFLQVEKCQHLAQLTKNIWQQPNQAFLLYELSQTVVKGKNKD